MTAKVVGPKVVKPKLYSVGAMVKVWSNIIINASSLEDAVARANTLEVSDFVTINDDFISGNIKILAVGVDYTSNDYSTDFN